ncbi:hypothetical protein ACOMHN_053272 [Nucella lapillus]
MPHDDHIYEVKE